MEYSLLVRIPIFLVGIYIIFLSIRSAVRTFLLPRAAPDPVTRVVFRELRRVFDWRVRALHTYEERDGVAAYYGPVGILLLLVAWLFLVLIGYTLMFWAIESQVWDFESWQVAFTLSGSSLFTLGYAPVAGGLAEKILTFTEAAIGPILIALLIGYMPTIYGAFSKREALVNLLEVRAGSPPSATDLIIRFTRLHRPERIGEMWVVWEQWFAELEETHTSLAMLNFFRSPQPNRSWVTAAGAVLDGAALVVAAVDIPPNIQANLCLRAGYIALRRIADYFHIAYNPDPFPTESISVTHAEFMNALDILKEEGVPLKPDWEQAWRDWAGWRVNYDAALLGLAKLTMSPPAPWSSPEIREQRRPPKTGSGS